MMSARIRYCIASIQTAPLLLFSASIGMRRRIADRMPRAATFARFEAAHRARSRCSEKKLRGAVDTVKNRDYVSPSRRFLRKQVSKTIATMRSSKLTSTRIVKTVDAGWLSPAKWPGAKNETLSRMQPGSPLVDRVFVCLAVAAHVGSPGRGHIFRPFASCSRRVAPNPFRRALHAGGWSRVRPRHCFVLGRTPR